MLQRPVVSPPSRRVPLRRRIMESLVDSGDRVFTEAQATQESVLLGSRVPRWQVRGLTPRQLQVVRMYLAGRKRRDICEELGISPSSLTKLTKRIIAKFRSGAASLSREAAIEFFLADARRRLYRPPRCCAPGREACWYTGVCPFA